MMKVKMLDGEDKTKEEKVKNPDRRMTGSILTLESEWRRKEFGEMSGRQRKYQRLGSLRSLPVHYKYTYFP